MYIEMFWTFRQSYKMLLFHIKIKSHIGNPVTVKEINRIFLINIHILTSDILMHKIKILKLILQLLLQTKLNCTTYINQVLFAATLFYYIHVLGMKWLALNYSCNGAESKTSSIYMHSSSFSSNCEWKICFL